MWPGVQDEAQTNWRCNGCQGEKSGFVTIMIIVINNNLFWMTLRWPNTVCAHFTGTVSDAVKRTVGLSVLETNFLKWFSWDKTVVGNFHWS